MPNDRKLSIRSIQGRTSRSIATSTADASALSGGVTGTATGAGAGAPLPLASPPAADQPPFTVAMVRPAAPVLLVCPLSDGVVSLGTDSIRGVEAINPLTAPGCVCTGVRVGEKRPRRSLTWVSSLGGLAHWQGATQWRAASSSMQCPVGSGFGGGCVAYVGI